jgi:putative colanic acid biosynthesis acetyltransferase WcaF
MSLLEASASRPLHGGPTYGMRHRLSRALWQLSWALLAAWTPPPMHRWRVWLVNRFGACVDAKAHIYPTARIWYPPNLRMEAHACLGPGVICYSMAPINLESNAIVSQGAHLCAGMHDIEDPDFQLLARPICIKAEAWVAAEAFVGPGVTIGERAVLGARAVLFRDAEPHGVYVGNPATLIRQRASTGYRA